jgi:hypothetical protein
LSSINIHDDYVLPPSLAFVDSCWDNYKVCGKGSGIIYSAKSLVNGMKKSIAQL